MTAKADRAKALLENPDLQEAFENVRQFYLQKIEELPLEQSRGDEALYDLRKQLFLLRQVREDLEKAVEHGNLEDYYSEQKETSILGDIFSGRRSTAGSRR